MVFISVTRLKLRSILYVLPFILHSYKSSNQAKQTEGFLKGKLMIEMNLSFWTITMWKDEQSMKIYRNSGAHLKAMPKLLNWSNEASVVSWTQQEEGFPTWKEAYNQLQERGRLSKVNNPSENHISKRIKEPVSTKFENLLYPPKSND